MRRTTVEYAAEAWAFYRDSESLADFVHVMRVRLSQSKVGRWVTPRPITVTVNTKTLGSGVVLRSHTTDISVFVEITFSHSLGHLPVDPSARVVLDLGANVGLSYRWLRRLYPAARIVCVEPDPGNLAILRANAKDDPDCEIIAACVGGRERSVRIASDIGEWGFRMVDGQGTIPVITMERLLDEYGIARVDVLKCDIEGAEGELFEDCAPWIGRIGTMAVECHLDTIDSDGLEVVIKRNGGRVRRTHLEANLSYGFEIVTLRRDEDTLVSQGIS